MPDLPENKYRRGTVIWSLMENALQAERDPDVAGWVDMTVGEIADVLGSTSGSIAMSAHRIWKETGYNVRYKRKKNKSRKSRLY